MNPSTNSPSPEPTRLEIQYRLTPEQQQLQQKIQERVRGMSRLISVFILVVFVIFLAAAGGAVFFVMHAVASFPLY